LINDSSNNTIRNCVLEGATTIASSGVVFFGPGLTTGNDNNVVTGNRIRDRSDVTGVPANLVYSGGTSDTVANSNNTISNNDLFNFTRYGLYVATGSESWDIIGNKIYQTVPRTESMTGISFNGLGTNAIRGNFIFDLMAYPGASAISLFSAGNATVVDNRLWNFGGWVIGGSAATVILVQPTQGQSVTVANNMITLGYSSLLPLNLRGIEDRGTLGSTVVVAHNTVFLAGTASQAFNSWAFARTGSSNATVKNNLFLNLRTGGGSHFAANYAPASAGSLVIDYNVYAGTGLTTATDIFDASSGAALPVIPISHAQWKANLPGDTHSSAGNPGGNYTSAMFVDPANGNLHLVPTGNVLVNNTGTPIAGVTTDYDGDARSPTSPNIGADELRPPFQQWAQANVVGDDPNLPGANGLANLLNFAFGVNPASASRDELSHAGNVITPGGITTRIVSGSPTAMFIRRADYVAAGLTYTAEFSADLTSWETHNTAPAVLASDGVNQVASLNYPVLSGGAQARFFRMVVGMQ
jgi:hypothetical protein